MHLLRLRLSWQRTSVLNLAKSGLDSCEAGITKCVWRAGCETTLLLRFQMENADFGFLGLLRAAPVVACAFPWAQLLHTQTQTERGCVSVTAVRQASRTPTQV